MYGNTMFDCHLLLALVCSVRSNICYSFYVDLEMSRWVFTAIQCQLKYVHMLESQTSYSRQSNTQILDPSTNKGTQIYFYSRGSMMIKTNRLTSYHRL
ncbi:hypothetical protein GGI35DRAFT_1116 [Trichoderma velutinum]